MLPLDRLLRQPVPAALVIDVLPDINPEALVRFEIVSAIVDAVVAGRLDPAVARGLLFADANVPRRI